MPREELLVQTFVTLADTLVRDFDVVDFLSVLSTRCVELFDAGDAGLLLEDVDGQLRVVASSSHQMHLLELFELQHGEGPCRDAHRTGSAVQVSDLRLAEERWPLFAPEAVRSGFRSVVALPLRLRNERIGALNLLRAESGALAPDDVAAAQALADVATIGILHHRLNQESRLLAEQLQYALTSRIVIEQAKGVVAERLGLDVDVAFGLIRSYGRSSNRRLADVARDIVDRRLDTGVLRTT